MMIHQINAGKDVRSKPRKRVGRGESSGWGKTAGRGNKGMKQRAGSGPHLAYEGGQMPYFRRMPKRGFSNFKFRVEYQIVNIGDLDRIFDENAVVDPAALFNTGLIKDEDRPVKILGDGELKKPLFVRAHKFSGSAVKAIEAVGGKVEVIG